jgi:hypothetical protein
MKVLLIVIVALAVLAGGYLLVLQAMGAPKPVTEGNIPTPESVSVIEGTYACLPRKDKSATKECSPGLKKEDGSFIALDLGEVIAAGGNPNLSNGTKLTVAGEVVKVDDLSTDQWDIYDVSELMRVLELAR